MKLPNADRVVVAEQKIVDYLLNAAHPDNGGKARFCEGLGFRRGEWSALAVAFQELVRVAEVSQTEESPHGRKYVRVGPLESPIGQTATVQTIWIVDRGSSVPRLVTAYPVQE